MADVSRGVSTTLGYVLNLGVAAILVTTLMVAAGSLVDTQRERAVDTELNVIGDRIASDLAAVDRLARASDDGYVRYEVEVPRRVVGATYDVSINESGNNTLVLAADRSDVTVSVDFDSQVQVESATRQGGPFTLVYENGTVEAEDA
jgi:hypothetical protein